MQLFVRLTLAIAAVILGLFVLVFVVKILIVAAVLAALAFAGLVVAAAVRRRLAKRPGSVVMTLTAGR
jgi:hypothetical protein